MSGTKDEQSPLPQPHPSDDEPTSLGDSVSSQAAGASVSESAALASLRRRYDILQELGRGGMGVVYKARDRETGDVVALKVLLPEIAARPELIERFKAELRLTRKITHKNVCRIHELLRFGDTVVIAMEYVEGESLRAILRRFGDVPLGRGQEWVQQICSGLTEAHAQGVIHRDLKPENILIDRHGNVKVMDFGIARSTEGGRTQAGTLVGTPAYMSPEQAEGKPADARSDIYSLGLVMYEMFTGRQAFKADTPVAYALKQIHDTPPPAREIEPDIPRRIDRAIQKCLEKNPAKRFQSVTELEAALSEKSEPKSVVSAGGEAELPLHLTHWQRSDWLLVGAAIAGLGLFFPFFNRTNLAPRSQVTFDRSVLRKIAQDYAQRLGGPVVGEGRIGTDVFPDSYDFVAERAGARVALELADNPVPYWTWTVQWDNGTNVTMENRGSLTYFSRQFPAGAPVERPPLEESKLLGEKALRDFFNRDPSVLRFETVAADNWREHPAMTLVWSDPTNYQGLKRDYTVKLVGRDIALLSSEFHVPPGFTGLTGSSSNRNTLLFLVTILIFSIWGIFQTRRVDLTARWRLVMVALFFLYGGSAGWRIFGAWGDTSFSIIYSSFLAIAIGLVGFLVSITLERTICRWAAYRFTTYNRLFDGRVLSEPCGLGILRGTFVGLTLLGANEFLIWTGTTLAGARLDSSNIIIEHAWIFFGTPWPTASVVLSAIAVGLMLAWTAAIFVSFLAHFLRRFWLIVLVAAALSAAVSPPGAIQPYAMKSLLHVFIFGILVWAFIRFDTLTVLVAAVTFAFCVQAYSLMVILEPTGAVEQKIAFLVWGILVLTAAAVAFKSSLRGAFQRFAAAFE